jgi:hypothetical protein
LRGTCTQARRTARERLTTHEKGANCQTCSRRKGRIVTEPWPEHQRSHTQLTHADNHLEQLDSRADVAAKPKRAQRPTLFIITQRVHACRQSRQSTWSPPKKNCTVVIFESKLRSGTSAHGCPGSGTLTGHPAHTGQMKATRAMLQHRHVPTFGFNAEIVTLSRRTKRARTISKLCLQWTRPSLASQATF